MLVKAFDKKVDEYKEQARQQIELIALKCENENKRLMKLLLQKDRQMQ